MTAAGDAMNTRASSRCVSGCLQISAWQHVSQRLLILFLQCILEFYFIRKVILVHVNIQLNSIQVYLHITFHNTNHCKAALLDIMSFQTVFFVFFNPLHPIPMIMDSSIKIELKNSIK